MLRYIDNVLQTQQKQLAKKYMTLVSLLRHLELHFHFCPSTWFIPLAPSCYLNNRNLLTSLLISLTNLYILFNIFKGTQRNLKSQTSGKIAAIVQRFKYKYYHYKHTLWPNPISPIILAPYPYSLPLERKW